MSKPMLNTEVELAVAKANRKHKKRSQTTTVVGPVTEWTDYHGLHLLFGLRRSTAYHLWSSEPELKAASISLKGEHESRGKRLFNVPQFRRFLESKQFPREAKSEMAP